VIFQNWIVTLLIRIIEFILIFMIVISIALLIFNPGNKKVKSGYPEDQKRFDPADYDISDGEYEEIR